MSGQASDTTVAAEDTLDDQQNAESNGTEEIPDHLNVLADSSRQKKCCGPQQRNLTAFWILGLCNNYAYVVMLSAAHDILAAQEGPNLNMTDLEPSTPINTTRLVPHCNSIGTGAILLADILPTLIVKLTAPFFMQSIPYWFRVPFLIAAPGIASFLLVGASVATWMSFLGVVLASFGAGVGEITFLALSSHFDKNVVSTWSSGTGGAGVFGALSYAGLIGLGVTPRVTLFLMIIIPLLLLISYFSILVKTPTVDYRPRADSEPLLRSAEGHRQQAMERGKYLPLAQKFGLITPLLKWMIPLAIVYFAEYFINQGLTELTEFEDIWLTLKEQYRWYAVIYQIGVFISRSSVNLVRFRRIWILAILQCANVILLLLQIYFKFLPTIWIMFVFILYEGLLGGAAYVNTFYMIAEEVSDEHLEYSMGVASVADSSGIIVAGLLAVPVHNYLCGVYI